MKYLLTYVWNGEECLLEVSDPAQVQKEFDDRADGAEYKNVKLWVLVASGDDPDA